MAPAVGQILAFAASCERRRQLLDGTDGTVRFDDDFAYRGGRKFGYEFCRCRATEGKHIHGMEVGA